MRLIDADELIEHAWRDKLDSRELIAEMIEKAPTIKEIPTKIPINVFEQLISLEPKTGRWQKISADKYSEHVAYYFRCSECGKGIIGERNYCPNCGLKMEAGE